LIFKLEVCIFYTIGCKAYLGICIFYLRPFLSIFLRTYVSCINTFRNTIPHISLNILMSYVFNNLYLYYIYAYLLIRKYNYIFNLPFFVCFRFFDLFDPLLNPHYFLNYLIKFLFVLVWRLFCYAAIILFWGDIINVNNILSLFYLCYLLKVYIRC